MPSSTCKHLEDVADYVLDLLPSNREESFVAHLNGCEVCRASIRHHQGTAAVTAFAARSFDREDTCREGGPI